MAKKITAAHRAAMQRGLRKHYAKKRADKQAQRIARERRITEFPLHAIPDIRKPPKRVVVEGARRRVVDGKDEVGSLRQENAHLRALLLIYIGRQS